MGLWNRDYMRQGGGFFREQKSGRDVLHYLIGINAAVFLLCAVAPGLEDALVLSGYGLEQGKVYQLLTSMFDHANLMHLIFNMWGLYLFGSIVAGYLSPLQFALLYLVSGLTGNALFLTFNWYGAGLLGASGAVYGIMMACAMLEPDRRFYIIFLPGLPLKMSTMIVCYTVLEILSEFGGADGVAHLAHLGGFAGGYVFMKIAASRSIRWDLRDLLRLRNSGNARFPGGTGRGKTPDWNTFRFDGKSEYRDPDAPVSQKELDLLLDKIANQGINSLSEAEMARLRRAREQMRGR